MPKKPRVGSNPLNWIQDTRDASNPENASKRSKLKSKSSKQSNLESNMGKSSKQEEPVSNPSNQGTSELPEVQQFSSVHSVLKAAEPNTSQRGLPDGWTRATFIMRQSHLDKIKSLAYWDRKEIKEVIDEALAAYLSGKNVKSIPPKRSM